MANSPQPEIDFVLLADHAEIQNGKLYVTGGGWDQLSVASFGIPVPIHLAVSVLVPPGHPGGEIPIILRLERPNGVPVGDPVEGRVQLLPVPLNRPGPARASFVGSVAWPFPEPGGYRIVATFGGSRAKSVPFTVAAASGQGQLVPGKYTIPDAPTTMH